MGCASSTSSEPVEATVSGLYAASGDGGIDSVVFTDDGQYWLKDRTCSQSTCLEHGRFAFVGKGDDRAIELTNESGVQRTLSLDVLSVVQSGTPLTTQGLTDGTSSLVSSGNTVLGGRADKMMLDGQPAELVKPQVAMFDCTAKFFPDGSLAGPWVGAGGWSWNRQECEEKAIGASVKKKV